MSTGSAADSVLAPGGPGVALSARLLLPALLACAVIMGGLVAVGDVAALLVCTSLLVGVFVLLDFRIGVALTIVLMPISESTLFPHSIAGVTGLNPLNLLLVATMMGFAVQHRPNLSGAPFLPRSLLWLYVLPIVVAGLMGSQHVGEIPSELADAKLIEFYNASTYLRDMLFKPMTMVVMALLLAAAAARTQRPERLLLAVLVAIWAMCLLEFGFVLAAGASLEVLASARSREFFIPLGIHANDLGRIYGFAYALMLFTCAEIRGFFLRALLIGSMLMVVLALVLTFSRGAFFGFVVANLLFLFSRRNVLVMVLGAVLLMVAVAVMPGVVMDRVSMGWGNGLNAISAGRIDEIWMPLLPELWRSPLIGNGLGSIAWSDAMRAGAILSVTHTHNAYLQTALDMGAVGLTLLGAYFVHVWRGFSRLGADPSLPPSLRGFYAGAKAGLISMLLAGMVGGTLTPGPEQIFLWIAIGMMYGYQRRAEA